MSVTNYNGRLEQMANYCKSLYVNLAKRFNVYYDDISDEYKKLLPNKYVDVLGIKSIGGKTLVWNQLINPNNIINRGYISSVGLTLTNNSNGSFTVNGTSLNENNLYFYNSLPIIKGHKYFIATDKYSTNGEWSINIQGYGITTADGAKIFTSIETKKSAELRFNFNANVTFNNLTIYPKITDLTLEFGTGNEPTVAEFESMFPADYYAYNAGELLSAGVTSIISKDSSDNTLQTISIPASIQALEGYGWSCPDAYNYIDFDTKKFVQAVGSRPYEAGDESDATVITDGTNTHYELDEPLEFDVELPDDILTEVEAGGSITFENQHGDDYCIPVPVGLEYIGVA